MQMIRLNQTPLFCYVIALLHMCFKLYSLNFAIAHAQKKDCFLCLSELVIIVLHKNTRTLSSHLKQAQKSIFKFIKFVAKC